MRSRAPAVLFLLTIAGVPLAQAGWELARGLPVQALGVFGRPSEARLRDFEDELRQASFIQRAAVPWVQWVLTRALGRGNEQAIAGRDDWLFYADDLDLVTGPDVMGPERAGERALETLVRLHAELAERGVALVLLPVPTKAMGEPARFTRFASELNLAQPPGMEAFHRRLQERGLPCVDLRAWLAACPPGTAFLERDTHWRPERMQAVAAMLADRVGSRLAPSSAATSPTYAAERVEASGRGDTEGMLSLPSGASRFAPEPFVLERVRDARTGADWTSAEGAEVLLLGDSFTRVFSDPELGMGAGAGLGEHLALALQREVDVIAMAGGGASGAREALARRPSGLAGVRVMVWQFTLRDLAGRAEAWRWIDLPEGGGRAAPEAEAAGPWEVVGEIVEVSRIDPDFDYDFCLGVFEYALAEGGERIWVAFPLLEEHESTDGAAFEVGDRQRLKLIPVETRYDLERTSWVDDTDAGRRIYWALEWKALP